jgi:death on curing protein
MDVIYLTIDGVMELHAIALRVGGGTGGIRSQQQLASALAQPEQSAFGEDLHKTIPEKAAAYGYFIAEGQPFLNGNKRTAVLAMETFLDVNGYELLEDEDSIGDMFDSLGEKTIDQSEFFGWVCNHAKPTGGRKRAGLRLAE